MRSSPAYRDDVSTNESLVRVGILGFTSGHLLRHGIGGTRHGQRKGPTSAQITSAPRPPLIAGIQMMSDTLSRCIRHRQLRCCRSVAFLNLQFFKSRSDEDSLTYTMEPYYDAFDDFFRRLPLSIWLAFSLVLIVLCRNVQFNKHTLIPGIPVMGRKWALEPLFITRFRFIMSGWDITREGLQKVR